MALKNMGLWNLSVSGAMGGAEDGLLWWWLVDHR